MERTLPDLLKEACESKWKKYESHYRNTVFTADKGKRERQIINLCRAAVVLDVVHDWFIDNNIRDSNRQVYDVVIAWLKENDNKQYFQYKYVPNNWFRLREKIGIMINKKYPSTKVIVLPRKGNQNTKRKAKRVEDKPYKAIPQTEEQKVIEEQREVLAEYKEKIRKLEKELEECNKQKSLAI